MSSGLPLKADIARCSWHVSKLPTGDSSTEVSVIVAGLTGQGRNWPRRTAKANNTTDVPRIRHQPDPCKVFVGYNRIEKMKPMSDWLSLAAALPASCRAAISFVVREMPVRWQLNL